MSGLSAQFVVLLTHSCFFALCQGTQKIAVDITAKAGQDVTLQCQKPTDDSITVLEWKKPDLKTELYVFYCRENRPYKNFQLSSFRGRVELRDPEMKNGDVSVILKNVTVNDTGTYECFVVTGNSRRRRRLTEFRQFIELKVTDSGLTAGSTEERGDKKGGHKEGGDEEGGNLGMYLLVPVIAVVIGVVVGFVLWKRQRSQKKNSELPAAVELQTLSPPSPQLCV
ncbi:coxsackievirus and adenovirus receptor homolog isoform 1-T1 [Symphorus nematophorus]